eukprot:TRINITY_DN47829_c0_g1_i2.p1 TRINITY_DN47829_c0_g1~~TRINITY_DN47829_c0_g1_i2.p1  ORF type:complete len:248 (-),score=3.35 TRINITY_DN47829_c0_g1_i2:141-884(-)
MWRTVRQRQRDSLLVEREIVSDKSGLTTVPTFKSSSVFHNVSVSSARDRIANLKWPSWIPNCQLIEQVHKISDGTVLLKCRFVSRWLSPREGLFFMTECTRSNGNDRLLLFTSDGTEPYVDEYINKTMHSGHIAFYVHRIFLRLRPYESCPNSTFAQVLFQIDLKGSVPHWLVANSGWLGSVKFLNLFKASFQASPTCSVFRMHKTVSWLPPSFSLISKTTQTAHMKRYAVEQHSVAANQQQLRFKH